MWLLIPPPTLITESNWPRTRHTYIWIGLPPHCVLTKHVERQGGGEGKGEGEKEREREREGGREGGREGLRGRGSGRGEGERERGDLLLC